MAADGIVERVRQGLAAAGKSVETVTTADLAAVDAFHVRGNAATAELLSHLRLEPDTRALDIGCGTGGAVRMLAETFGCHAVGVDLHPEFVETARQLSAWVGLSDRTEFHTADATSLPFADVTFDAVISQHVGMCVADKRGFYGEAARVLKPRGTLALYDAFAGPAGDIRFPVPWARNESADFAVTPDAMRERLTAAGFEITHWRDTTKEGLTFLEKSAARFAAGPPPALGIHLLIGDVFKDMLATLARNLAEGRVVLAEVVCTKMN